MVGQNILLLKKKNDKGSRPSNGFVLNIMGDLKRLEKGMSKIDVITILGEPIKIEKCSSQLNEKMVFKLGSNTIINTRYSALFTNNMLVYIAKIN